MSRTCLLALLVLLVAAPAANARPTLSLSRADRAAEQKALLLQKVSVNDYDAFADPSSPLFDPQQAAEVLTDTGEPYISAYIVSFDLDPCERVTATHAECAVTYYDNLSRACDELIDVRVTRRNKLAIDYSEYVCDDGLTAYRRG